MITIALCDDHEIVRRGIRQILEEGKHFKVVAEVSSAEQLLRELRSVKPNVIVLDISLPGRNGLEVLKQIRISYPKIKVLVLSMYPEDQYAIRAIKAGASGYLHKDSAPKVLYLAIETIARGDQYASPAMAMLLIKEVRIEGKSPAAPHKELSDREFEVLLLLGSGRKISDIALSMNLSVKTISTYKTRIFEKLDIHSIAEITHYLLKNDLMSETLAERGSARAF